MQGFSREANQLDRQGPSASAAVIYQYEEPQDITAYQGDNFGIRASEYRVAGQVAPEHLRMVKPWDRSPRKRQAGSVRI